jgi:hypothetical protein
LMKRVARVASVGKMSSEVRPCAGLHEGWNDLGVLGLVVRIVFRWIW